MFELVNLLAALVSAAAVVFIAHRANIIANNANSLAKQNNDISERATRLEADRHLLEWAQRVLVCASALVALRTLKKDDIDPKDFEQKRREHRASLFALKEEGLLFFRFSGKADAPDAPAALKALNGLTSLSDGRVFKIPTATYADDSVKELRTHVRAFIKDVQARLGSHWSQ